MAVSIKPRPLLRGLDLVPGSLALIGLRAGLLLLAALPSLLLFASSINAGPARQPYFTEVGGRLPVFHLLRLFDELGQGFVLGLCALTALLTLLGEQLLVAGGLDWLCPERTRERPVRSVLKSGLGWLWPMLKVLLLAALFAGLGLTLIGRGFAALTDHGEVAGWSGYAMKLLLPALRGGASVLWLALVGAWAFWCRVLMVADGRRTARNAWVLVARLAWRRPLRGPLFYVVVTLLLQAGSALVLVSWRQSPPTSGGGVALWGFSWLLVLVVQAFAWHWLLHAARLLYAAPELDGLRQRPDGPLGLWAGLRRLVRRLRRRT